MAGEVTSTFEHAAVDWDYDYAEHATQHAAEHVTQHNIADGHATHGNVTQSATRLAQLNATAVHYNRNTGTQEQAPAHKHTGTSIASTITVAGIILKQQVQHQPQSQELRHTKTQAQKNSTD